MKFYKLTILQLMVFVFLMLSILSCSGEKIKIHTVEMKEEILDVDAVTLKGILGEAIVASENGRIKTLPEWENGQLITMFSKRSREKNAKMDWYGEHGGKWLYMAAKAAKRSGDEKLKKSLLKNADILISYQDDDGYLGTYSSTQCFMSDVPNTHKWSWDVWNVSYMALGLLEVNKNFPNAKYLDAAKKIGELFLNTFGEGKKNITNYGTRNGLSATVILDPLVELFEATNDNRYLKLAEYVIYEMENRKELRLIHNALKKNDMTSVGDGKAYQLCWNLTAMAKLYRVTANPDYLQAVKNAWQNILDEHLSITGGPWGGIGQHYEIFNRKGFWSPYGFVETCSIMSWMDLNRELLAVTGEAKYAQQIETSAYNALLGAQFPNGENWCYHSFTNGCRHIAKYNDCCPSSGAIALEEISPMVYALKEDGIACNLYTPNIANISLSEPITVQIEQKTNYPYDGEIVLNLSMKEPSAFPLFIRIPEWAEHSFIAVNDNEIIVKLEKSGYAKIERQWENGDKVIIKFPMTVKIHQTLEHIPKYDEDISALEWFALTRGPLVYAVDGLLFGKERESVVDIPLDEIKSKLKRINTQQYSSIPAYQIKLDHKRSLRFLPYYLADGREKGSWRLTWIQNKIR